MLVRLDSEPTFPQTPHLSLPSFSDGLNGQTFDEEPRLSDDDEDALLKDTTGSFAAWIDSFIRRVIQLLENLPEEGENGSASGETEGSSFGY
jgi:proteasome activator subunit 4